VENDLQTKTVAQKVQNNTDDTLENNPRPPGSCR
jgi:hypothetical protein